jgi:serine/threonine protein kinase
MGEVWKARDTRLGRAVAIKRLKPEHAERFQREARAIAAMNHPHICQLYDVGPDYLVMEYIEGSPLTGPLPTKDALRLALQIADALQEAHSRGILHRDLKPGNILVTEKGSAKLLDFGLAKLLDSDPDVTISHSRFSNPCRGRLHFSVY